MPLEIYSGNKSGSGGALFVTFNSKDYAVFLRILKQTGWNNQTSKPSFSGGATINVKLSADEIGDLIHAINGHDTCKFYHKFKDEATSGSFSYYEKEYQGKDGKPTKSRGFGLTVRKNELEVKIGFSLGTAEKFSQYLQFALNHMFSAIYVQDKKESEEYWKKKNGEQLNKKTAPKTKEVTPEVEEVVDSNVPEVEENTEDNISW